MSLAVIQSRAKSGIDAPLVSVEVHLSNGLPAFHLVGLPETSVKESKDRVRKEIRQVCPLDEQLKDLMNKAIERFGLSARGFYRVLKVARSLADLDASKYPKSRHYQEALSYRPTIPENQRS